MRLAAGLREAVLEAAFIGELSFREETDTPVSKIAPEIVDYRSSYSSVPKGWIVARFSDLYELVNGLASRGTKGGTERPVIRLADISSGKIDDSSLRNILLSDKEYDSHQVNHGDIIIIRVNGSFSRVANAFYYDGERTFSYCDHLFCGHPKTKAVFPPFFTMMVNSPSFRKLIMPSIKTTAGQYTISQKSLGQTLIPLPPIEEQQRIVDRVNELMLAINEYEETENRLIALKEAFPGNLRNAVIQAAMQGKITEQHENDSSIDELLLQISEEKNLLVSEGKIDKLPKIQKIRAEEIPFDIPESWRWVRWGELSNSIQYGYNAPAQTIGDALMVRISDISNNEIKWGSVPRCTIDLHAFKKYQLFENDILFARTGGTVGKSVLAKDVPSDAVFAGYLIRSNYSKRLVPQYLKYFMESELYWRQLRNGTTQTAQPNCNGKTLSKMLIPLPPVEEQRRIVEQLDRLLPLCDELN